MNNLNKLRFPIGEHEMPKSMNQMEVDACIVDIAAFPERLEQAVENLTDLQLDTTYRPNGWTIRQVVHHCADSHLNSYTRFKLALTEDTPTVKPYMEALWAELPDGKMSIQPSLFIIRGLHQRWAVLLRSLNLSDFDKKVFHPEQNRYIPLLELLSFYAWHSNHHLAHITNTFILKH